MFADGESWTVYEVASVELGLGIPVSSHGCPCHPGAGQINWGCGRWLGNHLLVVGATLGVFQPLAPSSSCPKVALCGFCLAELRLCCVGSALPNSGDVGGFSSFLWIVCDVFWVPRSRSFEAGCSNVF